jgi:hypothetical protein
MKGISKSKAVNPVIQLAEYWQEVYNRTFLAADIDVKLSSDTYRADATGLMKQKIKENNAIISKDLLVESTAGEIKLLSQIIAGICMNNSLFYIKEENMSRREKDALNNLLRRKIIFRTLSENVFLINPFKIRNGHLITVIVATYELCQNKINKLDETSIRMLRKPDEVKMDKVINLILSIEPEAFGIK